MADENTISTVITQRIDLEQAKLTDVNKRLTELKSLPTTSDHVREMVNLVNVKISAEQQIQALQSI